MSTAKRQNIAPRISLYTGVDEKVAHAIFEKMQKAFGNANCHLLQFNSRTLQNDGDDGNPNVAEHWTSMTFTNRFRFEDISIKIHNSNFETLKAFLRKNFKKYHTALFLQICFTGILFKNTSTKKVPQKTKNVALEKFLE